MTSLKDLDLRREVLLVLMQNHRIFDKPTFRLTNCSNNNGRRYLPTRRLWFVELRALWMGDLCGKTVASSSLFGVSSSVSCDLPLDAASWQGTEIDPSIRSDRYSPLSVRRSVEENARNAKNLGFGCLDASNGYDNGSVALPASFCQVYGQQ